ncbi:MAG: adenylate cyclase regulatory domain-containing protein [Mycobacteriales bacterium]
MEDLDALLLGAPLSLTSEQVVERAGVPEELADAVWAAMGFPELQPDDVAFTEEDVRALQRSAELLDSGIIDADTWLVMARAMGQGLSRLAEAQIDVFRRVAGDGSAQDAADVALRTAPEVVPQLEELVLFMWRRQFAAAVQRALATDRGEGGLSSLAIGFVDLVDYTRSSRTWDTARLERTLERFERDTALRVTAVGGRVVKTLGDGVLYTTPTPLTAVQVALDTVEAHRADEELPAVRAGVATGPVLVRLGDVYGEPVNLASRLADEARPSSVLVDKVTAGELDGLQVRPLARRSVRGYRALTPHLVRRDAQTGQAGPGGALG